MTFWEDERQHLLHLYACLLRMQLRSQLRYRLAFSLDFLATAFTVIAEFASLAVVSGPFGHMRGWTLGEVAFLYGMVEFAEPYGDVSVEPAELSEHSDNRAVYTFARNSITATELIGRLTERFRIRDLSVE